MNWASALSMQLTETQYRPWKKEVLKAHGLATCPGLHSYTWVSLTNNSMHQLHLSFCPGKKAERWHAELSPPPRT